MRLCMLTTSYPRGAGDSAGGFVSELALALSREDDTEVTILAPAAANVSRYEKQGNVTIHRIRYFWPRRLQKLAYGDGIPWNIKTSKVAKLNIPFFLLAFAWKLVFFSRKADIVHAHWGVLGAVAVAMRFFHRLPVVVMIRGTDMSTDNRLIRAVTRWAIKRADAIITNSPEYREIICDLREEKSLYYIHNGVEYPSDSELSQLQAKYESQSSGGNIVSVARLIPERRYDVLIKAFAVLHRKHPDVTLTLVGNGPHKKTW